MVGKNMVDEQSLRNAIYEAIDVWHNRQNYDEPLEHPLPKLYHEKRDDSEKVRFRSSNDDASRNKEPRK
jgi:4-hydroxythreonine-4-phosphate dehydrogenase